MELVDKDGQALTPEQIQENINKLEEENKRLATERGNTVEELKVERKLRQEAEDKLKPKDDVSVKIQEALEEERKRGAGLNRLTALKKFQEKNKEFHPENDASGLKVAALEREFGSFNTSELSSEEEFESYYEKASILLSKKGTMKESETIKPDLDTSKNTQQPKERVDSKLDAKEQQLLKELGWTEERYLKVKASQPRFVSELLATKR